jgi:hypothetical protein
MSKPVLESCESRELLSGWSVQFPPAWLARASATKVISLHGTLHGHYAQNTINPDVGSAAALSGSGMISGFGKSFVSASLHSVGFIANGSARGTVLLAGIKGTLTLSLTAATAQNGPAPLPSRYTFKVVVGTGKFWNAHDAGTVSLKLTPKNSLGWVTQGTFSLVLTSDPVPTPSRIR